MQHAQEGKKSLNRSWSPPLGKTARIGSRKKGKLKKLPEKRESVTMRWRASGGGGGVFQNQNETFLGGLGGRGGEGGGGEEEGVRIISMKDGKTGALP